MIRISYDSRMMPDGSIQAHEPSPTGIGGSRRHGTVLGYVWVSSIVHAGYGGPGRLFAVVLPDWLRDQPKPTQPVLVPSDTADIGLMAEHVP